MNKPDNCDLCGKKIENEFWDGPTSWGSWAYMCRACCYNYNTNLRISSKFVKTGENTFEKSQISELIFI